MKTICLAAIFFLMTLGLKGQNIEDLISKYTQENGKKFIQPLADAVWADFNSGLFHSAYIKKKGFQMYLGLVTTTAFIPEKRTTFLGTPEGFFEPKNPVKVPTIFGTSENVVVNGTGGTQYVFPGGLNLGFFPLAMPQLTIGSLFGTDLTIRYLAGRISDDIGKSHISGFGLRHSISQYIPSSPVDLAAGVYKQQFDIGDIVAADAWLFNVQASYKASVFIFYGALGYETSTLNLDYSYNDSDGDHNVSFDLKGSNSVRLTTGLTFDLGPFKLNADYNFASQNVLTIGLGFGTVDRKNNKSENQEK